MGWSICARAVPALPKLPLPQAHRSSEGVGALRPPGVEQTIAPSRQPATPVGRKTRSKTVACVLAVLLGSVAAQRFYLGYWKSATALVGVFLVAAGTDTPALAAAVMVCSLVDAARIATGHLKTR